MALTAAGAERDRVEILGLSVDRLTMAGALETLQGFIASGQPHTVVTADSSGLVIAGEDPAFAEIVRQAELVTADSAGILWAGRRLGRPFPERVSGVDLVAELCRLSADKGYRLYFLGAAPGVAEVAAEKLRLRYPGCNIVGIRHGFFPSESDEVVAREIAEKMPDVLFVAMGIPRQEKFIAATREIVRAPVAIGVGGSFDVFSGRAKRAPKLVQRLSLEWLWRVLLNPRKISKVKTLPRFAWMVLRDRRR
jgi:N-acetylglucosaminyldiphosphoundecaprenol N-acetyl-beta-D-mannosaminyltransferase